MTKIKNNKMSNNQEKIKFKLKKMILTGAISLGIATTLLGCGEKDNSKKIYVHNNFKNTIIYGEDDTITGTLPASEIDGYVKIVTFKQYNVTFTRLVAIEDRTEIYSYGTHSIVKYYDLDTGTTLIERIDNKYVSGENLEIISKIDLMPFLYQEGNFQDEYEINYLLAFYHEKVEPILAENEELILN